MLPTLDLFLPVITGFAVAATVLLVGIALEPPVGDPEPVGDRRLRTGRRAGGAARPAIRSRSPRQADPAGRSRGNRLGRR